MNGLFTKGGSADEAAKVLRHWADSNGADGDGLFDAVGTIIDERDHLKRIARTAIDMRRAQREYFRTRKPGDLEHSKKLERDLDRLLKE